MPSSENLSSLHEAQEKCGIVLVATPGIDAIEPAFAAIKALQHRGQDGAGLATLDGQNLQAIRGEGRVNEIFPETPNLKGDKASGHTLYGTSFGNGERSIHRQPVISPHGRLIFSHNGNLPSTRALDRYMEDNGILNNNNNDSEKAQAVTEHQLLQGKSLVEALKAVSPLLTGVFSLALMDTKTGEVAAVRDNHGIRPLAMGRNENGYAFASETVALDAANFLYEREIRPGEIFVLNGSTASSEWLDENPREERLDSFEFVYFSRPESIHQGRETAEARRQMGRQSGRQMPSSIDIDVALGVPNSGLLAAEGFAEELGLQLVQGLKINPDYKRGRTFIGKDGENKMDVVRSKLYADPALVRGKSVAVVEDSIVRGNTFPPVVEMLREAGAREVHAVVASPPVRFTDYYGINMQRWLDLIANRHENIEGVAQELGVDSVHYLSLEGLIKAIGIPKDKLSTHVFDGIYHSPIHERVLELGVPSEIGLHSAPRKLVTSQF